MRESSTVTGEEVTENGEAAFAARNMCIACSSAELEVIWEAGFDEEPVQAFLGRSAYAGNALGHLASQRFALVECRRCNLRFQRRVLAEQWLGRLYGEWIDERQVALAEENRNEFEDARQLVKHVLRLERIFRRAVPAGRRPRVLDYGCGAGRFVALCRLFGWDALGVDHSATRGRQAGMLGIGLYSDLSDVDAATREPMDAVTLFQVLEHVTDPRALLAALAKRLVPGGVMVVEVPNCEGIDVPKTLTEFNLVHPLEHINVFTPRTLRGLCEGVGFVPIPRGPAHATSKLGDVVKTEATRFIKMSSTNQYFRRTGSQIER